jgi:hypothetical protein
VNHQFWFFENKESESKEPPIPVISNPFKEPPVFMIEPTKNW